MVVYLARLNLRTRSKRVLQVAEQVSGLPLASSVSREHLNSAASTLVDVWASRKHTASLLGSTAVQSDAVVRTSHRTRAVRRSASLCLDLTRGRMPGWRISLAAFNSQLLMELESSSAFSDRDELARPVGGATGGGLWCAVGVGTAVGATVGAFVGAAKGQKEGSKCRIQRQLLQTSTATLAIGQGSDVTAPTFSPNNM